MAVYKFSLDKEHSDILEAWAREDGVTVQDCIRNKLFETQTIYTPAEAVRRAIEKYKLGDTFTLPDLYGDDWQIERGPAGVFGRNFYNYVEAECQDIIKFDQMVSYGRRAQYAMI